MRSMFILPLLCALASTSVSAQAPGWSMGGRLAFGAALAGKEPQNGSATIGAGFWVERTLDESSGLFCEFNYQYFYAVMYEATKFGWGYRPDPNNPGGTITGLLTPIRSMDTRKDQLDGYGFMLGYRSYVNSNLSAHFGVGANVWISQQEVVGELMVTDTATSTGGQWSEGLAYIASKRSLLPVVNAGVRYQFTPNAGVEGNLRYITWKQANYVPFAYTGRAAHTDDITRTKVTFDISLTIKF